jgi:hypothetical protein
MLFIHHTVLVVKKKCDYGASITLLLYLFYMKAVGLMSIGVLAAVKQQQGQGDQQDGQADVHLMNTSANSYNSKSKPHNTYY